MNPDPKAFRKKPVTIYAMQYHGGNDGEIQRWAHLHGTNIHTEVDGNGTHSLVIPTLEGDHRADLGDWIIQGVQNEFYPCKPDIFQMTYEPVDTARTQSGLTTRANVMVEPNG